MIPWYAIKPGDRVKLLPAKRLAEHTWVTCGMLQYGGKIVTVASCQCRIINFKETEGYSWFIPECVEGVVRAPTPVPATIPILVCSEDCALELRRDNVTLLEVMYEKLYV